MGVRAALRKTFGSLYWKIAATFLALLAAFAAIMFWIFLQGSREINYEITQRLNDATVKQLAADLQPFLRESIDYTGFFEELLHFYTLNRHVSAFILDSKGRINTSLMIRMKHAKETVRLEPIYRYLSSRDASDFPIYGDDVLGRDLESVPFTVAPITVAGEPGYLYLIPGSSPQLSFFKGISATTVSRNLVLLFGFALAITAIVGLLLFSFVTKRFYRLASLVSTYAKGDYHVKIPLGPPDEIGQLQRTIEDMAQRISENIEMLKEKDELRRELVGNISHDLRGPLASIQGYAETLTNIEKEKDPSSNKCVAGILTNVRFLDTLTKELFELTKLEAREIAPDSRPFFLTGMFEDTITTFTPVADAKKIDLQHLGVESVGPVLADEEMIQRVLFNLVDNAIRHTPESGRVRLQAKQVDTTVHISVSDSGSGIPQEDKSRIFERLYRVEKDRSRRTGGAGLGLAIVKKILDAHSCAISVDSKSTGATFSFSLPLATQ